MNIMFICTGNICRSAMAHKMLEKKLKELNRNDVKVYSCGVYAENGDKPTFEGNSIMKEYGIDLSTHRATNIFNSKIKDMDIILCATTSHKNNVLNTFPELKDKIFTMKEYVDFPRNDLDISDPWACGYEIYKNCAKEIDEVLDKIILKI